MLPFSVQVLYTTVQMNATLCAYLANNSKDIGSLLAIIAGKIELADMEFNSVIETVIHILSVIIMQLRDIPHE